MKASAILLALVLISSTAFRAIGQEARGEARTNATSIAKPAAVRKPEPKPVRSKAKKILPVFKTEQETILNRKATLYGINPNLLMAVLRVEVSNGGGSQAVSDEEFAWMAEMSARALRHCLDQKSNLASALTYYAVGSWDYNRIDESALRFSRQVRKLFGELEKARPWKPDSNSNKTH